ncbi:SLBB domain-containing protein [Psychromonas sp. MME1]|uniref:SLBB domain-containing protein n=1 Tax=Psychromonas sp. MME1 TaxID=3231032 RepID=UPI0034E257A8
MKNIMRKIGLSMLFFTTTLFAQTPTAAQMAQFKQLPRAQQEQLAKQYGVDLSASGSSEVAEKKPYIPPTKTVAERNIENVDIKVDYQSGKQLKPFGYDVLAGQATNSPIDDIPIPNDYIMGPGDEIKIELYGKVNNTFNLKVTREGKVHLPELGPINLSGLTFQEAREELTNSINNKIIGVDSSITMGSLRLMQVYIVGESAQPGAYNVNPITTVTQALVASGGVKVTGSLRNIQLKRKGQIVTTLDMYDLILKGNTANDVRLQGGDTLFIPPRENTVVVDGAVMRPAIYELKNNTSLNELIELAGGTQMDAFLQNVTVRRLTTEGVEVKSVDLSNKQSTKFSIKNGDVVQVSQVNKTLTNAIAVRGEVIRQGVYQFVPGMKVNDVITSIASDLKLTTDLNYALVVREINAQHDIEVLQFDLGEAIKTPHSRENLTLQKLDQIFVFSNSVNSQFWRGETEKSALLLEQERNKEQLSQAAKEKIQQDGMPEKMIDDVTGAEVEVSSNQDSKAMVGSELASQSVENLRESQLEPILTRLRSQASLINPIQVIEIGGDVKYPGTYPLVKNGHVKDAIKAAGGLLESAYLNEAELTRTSYVEDDLKIKQYRLDLHQLDAANSKSNYQLRSKDRLNILTKPGWNDELVVTLQGEVRFPGEYSFKRGETIKDIVLRAGGLTRFANAEGAVFAREQLKIREAREMKYLKAQMQQQISAMTLRKNSVTGSYASSPQDALNVVNELETLPALGRMVINLPEILNNNEKLDVQLANEDKIYIPELVKAVSIIGEVQFKSTHTFDENLTLDDYIDLAGGMKKQADNDRIYVIRANGSVMVPKSSYWFNNQNQPLKPGDTIVVPIDVDYMDGLSAVATATQIVYQLGVAWSAINN